MWRAIFETASGRLESVGTVWADPLPAGLDFKAFRNRPDDADMWDEATTSFVPRPPKVLIDRWEDVRNAPTVKADFDALPAATETRIANHIKRILGDARFRNVTESDEIGR